MHEVDNEALDRTMAYVSVKCAQNCGLWRKPCRVAGRAGDVASSFPMRLTSARVVMSLTVM
jgi:hypothetical protein